MNDKVLAKLVFGITFLSYLIGWLGSALLAWYLLFFAGFRWLVIAYLFWMVVFDLDAAEKGGRKVRLMQYLKIWKLCTKYFTVRLELEQGCELDSRKNYLFACFPHGVIPMGVLSCTFDGNLFKKCFPEHTASCAALKGLFYWPFYREFVMALGFVAASTKSLRWLLADPKGANIVCLFVGGSREALNCLPGDYKLVLRRRKGFAKTALECGSPLVPVFTFGENELYHQLGAGIPLVRKVQDFIVTTMGWPPIFLVGCGVFQDRFGIIPRQKPLTVIIGRPIPVEKVDHPSGEQIDGLHAKFVDELVKLFEDNKHKHVKDADNVSLIIK